MTYDTKSLPRGDLTEDDRRDIRTAMAMLGFKKLLGNLADEMEAAEYQLAYTADLTTEEGCRRALVLQSRAQVRRILLDELIGETAYASADE